MQGQGASCGTQARQRQITGIEPKPMLQKEGAISTAHAIQPPGNRAPSISPPRSLSILFLPTAVIRFIGQILSLISVLRLVTMWLVVLASSGKKWELQLGASEDAGLGSR